MDEFGYDGRGGYGKSDDPHHYTHEVQLISHRVDRGLKSGELAFHSLQVIVRNALHMLLEAVKDRRRPIVVQSSLVSRPSGRREIMAGIDPRVGQGGDNVVGKLGNPEARVARHFSRR
jgi:hypothetical protein